MLWNLPNLLTMLRIVLIPVFVVAFYLDVIWAPYAAGAIFGVAALTAAARAWLDG